MTATVAPEETAQHLRRITERQRRTEAARAERFRRLLPEAAKVSREGYQVQRVVLFGSLATGRYREDSDVDLAVEGLRGDLYFDALSKLMALFRGPVDLVCLEEAPESLRQRIADEGEPL
jgi:predicted nucleotidyltransferase